MKRDSVSAYPHMRSDTPPSVRSSTHFGSPTSCQLRTYLIDGPFLNNKNKTYKDIQINLQIPYSLKYKHSNK